VGVLIVTVVGLGIAFAVVRLRQRAVPQDVE